MRRVNPWLINGTAVLLLAGGSLWVAPQVVDFGRLSYVPEQAAESLSTVGLSVEEVLVTGRRNTDGADILDALGAVRGTPIFEIDIPAAKARVTALPWVESAEIVRNLPNSLHISLHEHTAFALWQHEGRHTLVAQDGTSITDVDETYGGLPIVVGDDAPANAKTLMTALSSQPALNARLKAAVRFGGRRWDILLDHVENGVVIKLPETDIAAAWDGLAALDSKHQLLSRAVSEIDLRVAGRLVVKLKDGYAPLPKVSDQISAEQEVRLDPAAATTKELAKGV